MPELNQPLFEKIAAQIEERPWLYKQTVWGQVSQDESCGTAYCVAGWALYFSGYVFDSDSDSFIRDGESLYFESEIMERARYILGITEYQSVALFDSDWMQGREHQVPDKLREIARGGMVYDDV